MRLGDAAGGYRCVSWKTLDVAVGDAVFLEPHAFTFRADVIVKKEREEREELADDQVEPTGASF